MKTRILHTKFWTDSYTLSLSPVERLLLIFYFTNEYVGLTGIYEIALQVVQLSTGLTRQQIKQSQDKFMHDGKLVFYNDWVYIKNYERYQSYKGDKNEVAYKKELSLIPQDTLSILYGYTMPSVFSTENTTINHNTKTEIINNKEGGAGGNKNAARRSVEEITSEDLEKLATDYNVPMAFVLSKLDDLTNYCSSHGKRYKDYLATLRNWVKKDALERREHAESTSRIAYVGEPIAESP